MTVHRLVIKNPRLRFNLTAEWLTRHMLSPMLELSPGLGLGVLRWRDGEYSLPYDVGVPMPIKQILPKHTNREFSHCLAEMQLTHHSLPLAENMSRSERVWLLAFPEGEFDFDLATDTIFSVGAGIIADAWAEIDMDGPQVPA
jgi:hypothetical protein